MALIDVRLLQSLRLTERLSDKQTTQYSASEDFLILSDTKNPSFGDILDNKATWPKLNNSRLPRLRDTLTLNGKRFYVNSRDLSHYKDNERAVVMTVRYDSKDSEDDQPPPPPSGTSPDSWLRWTMQTQQMTEPARGWVQLPDTVGKRQNDAGQDKPRNSAGDPVDGLEEDTSLIRMTYTNSQVVNPDFVALQSYTNVCNSVPFKGGLEYTVRCLGWSAEYDQKNQTWSVTVEFLYKPNDWSITFYDVGFNEIIDGERRAILDLAGNPVSSPVPLNGNGRAEAIGGGGPTGGNFQPVPLSFRYLYPYPSKDLNQVFNQARI
jgi:hypothetical protein